MWAINLLSRSLYGIACSHMIYTYLRSLHVCQLIPNDSLLHFHVVFQDFNSIVCYRFQIDPNEDIRFDRDDDNAIEKETEIQSSHLAHNQIKRLTVK